MAIIQGLVRYNLQNNTNSQGPKILIYIRLCSNFFHFIFHLHGLIFFSIHMDPKRQSYIQLISTEERNMIFHTFANISETNECIFRLDFFRYFHHSSSFKVKRRINHELSKHKVAYDVPSLFLTTFHIV